MGGLEIAGLEIAVVGIAAESLVALGTEQADGHIAQGKRIVVHRSETAGGVALEDIEELAQAFVEEHFLQQSSMAWQNRLLG